MGGSVGEGVVYNIPPVIQCSIVTWYMILQITNIEQVQIDEIGDLLAGY